MIFSQGNRKAIEKIDGVIVGGMERKTARRQIVLRKCSRRAKLILNVD